MRDFLDAILAEIEEESLTDEEFENEYIQALDEQEYTEENYEGLKVILNSREGVTDAVKRLKGYFVAKGMPGWVPSSSSTKIPGTNILIGAKLC